MAILKICEISESINKSFNTLKILMFTFIYLNYILHTDFTDMNYGIHFIL